MPKKKDYQTYFDMLVSKYKLKNKSILVSILNITYNRMQYIEKKIKENSEYLTDKEKEQYENLIKSYLKREQKLAPAKISKNDIDILFKKLRIKYNVSHTRDLSKFVALSTYALQQIVAKKEMTHYDFTRLSNLVSDINEDKIVNISNKLILQAMNSLKIYNLRELSKALECSYSVLYNSKNSNFTSKTKKKIEDRLEVLLEQKKYTFENNYKQLLHIEKKTFLQTLNIDNFDVLFIKETSLECFGDNIFVIFNRNIFFDDFLKGETFIFNNNNNITLVKAYSTQSDTTKVIYYNDNTKKESDIIAFKKKCIGVVRMYLKTV